jgi:hypothetical protein
MKRTATSYELIAALWGLGGVISSVGKYSDGITMCYIAAGLYMMRAVVRGYTGKWG